MVPDRYPLVAGILAGVVTLRDQLVPAIHAWVDADVATIATYYATTAWLAFLFVPVAALAVGYVGGRTASGGVDLGRAGLVCLAVGVASSVLAVGVGVVLMPPSVEPASNLFLQVGTYAFGVVRPPVLAAVSVVAGASLGAARTGA